MRLSVLVNIACLFFILSCNHKYYKSTIVEYKIYSSSDIDHENLNSIRALDLSDDTNSLPSKVFEMENLLYLNLNNKNLKNFPADICKLKSLKVLLLNGNRFDRIPECLFELNKLETITLFGCYLDSIPHGFSQLEQLTLFGIGGNNFNKSDVTFFKQNLPNCNIITSLD